MNITVHEGELEHFFEEPTDDTVEEFWAFRFPQKAKPGDLIRFWHYPEGAPSKLLATATVSRVEPPGESACDTTGRFENRWKVFWTLESFLEINKP